MVSNDLSAGLCDNCVHCGILYDGNGIDEPLQSVPYCPKTEKEVITVNDKNKEMRISNCEYFEAITIIVTQTNPV